MRVLFWTASARAQTKAARASCADTGACGSLGCAVLVWSLLHFVSVPVHTGHIGMCRHS